MTDRLRELVVRMRDLQNEAESQKEALKSTNEALDHLRLVEIPNEMQANDIRSVSYEGIGRVQLAGDVYASIPSDSRDSAYGWLKTNGFGDLITETVHPSTFKAFVKEQMKNGTCLPEDMFKVTPFTRASIVKK